MVDARVESNFVEEYNIGIERASTMEYQMSKTCGKVVSERVGQNKLGLRRM